MLINVYSVGSDGAKTFMKAFDTMEAAEEYVDIMQYSERMQNDAYKDMGLAVSDITQYIIERPGMTEDDKLIQRNNKVFMANTIINDMEYNLSRHYLLLLRYMISKIKSDDKPNKRYSISIKEFFQICGIDEKNGGNYVRIVKNAYETIQSKVKWIESKGDKYAVQWFADFVIKKNRTIEYEFHRRITPYLFDLVHFKEGYTGYVFEDAVALDTNYGIRLYEWVREFKNMGLKHKSISLDDLKVIVGGHNYKLYNDFNRFILKKAVDDINKTTDIDLRYTKIIPMGSKAVTAVYFKLGDITDDEVLAIRQENKQAALRGYISEV